MGGGGESPENTTVCYDDLGVGVSAFYYGLGGVENGKKRILRCRWTLPNLKRQKIRQILIEN